MSADKFVGALRRYVGALEYRPGKTTFVKETDSGPRGFTDCAGLPLLALRDIGLIEQGTDFNFPDEMNREAAILRVLRRLGKRVPEATRLHAGDILITGTTRRFHVMTVSDLLADTFKLIEAPRAHGWICERRFDGHEHGSIRSAFRLFNG